MVLYADKSPILVVVPGDKRLDMKKFKKEFKVKDLRMASPEDVFQLTNLKIGSIPPFGKSVGLKSYCDSSFKEKGQIAFNAGLHTTSIFMQARDYLHIEQPALGDIL